jgi:hypothetical protein
MNDADDELATAELRHNIEGHRAAITSRSTAGNGSLPASRAPLVAGGVAFGVALIGSSAWVRRSKAHGRRGG